MEYEDDNVELGKEVDGAVPAQEDVVAFCHPCKGNVCYCEDERQAIFVNSEAEHQEEEEVPRVEYEDDEIYWSAEEDSEDETADNDDSTEASGDSMQRHRLCNTKYGSKQLVPMTAILAKSIVSMSKGQGVKIQALADSGSSASIISLELAIKLGLEREDPGDTKLTDASGARMDVTAVATVAVREMEGILSCFQVLVSRYWQR